MRAKQVSCGQRSVDFHTELSCNSCLPGCEQMTSFEVTLLSGLVELCWVRAASGPFFGELFICTESGFKMGFCQWAGMGQKVGQKWVFGCKSGVKRGQNPLLHPLLNPFRDFHENPLLPSLRGVEIVFQKRP